MEHPKYTLTFDHKNPAAPLCIREHDVMDGKLAYRVVASYRHFQDAFEALSSLSQNAVLVAYSAERVVYE